MLPSENSCAMPRLSVITVNLNNRAGLQKTIESVEAQRFTDFEWLVVDGGSTDGSRELLADHADRISHWVSEPDHGIFQAMNKGIRASSGTYLLFLNSGDALCDAEVLAKAVPQLQGKDFYVGNEWRGDTVVYRRVATDAELCASLTEASFPHQSTFIHRRVFSEYGYYREDLRCASDWWFFYRAVITGTASVEKLHLTVAVFDMHGISQTEQALAERRALLATLPRVDKAVRFYYENSDIVSALRANRSLFFLFRCYFFCYRTWKKWCKKFSSRHA